MASTSSDAPLPLIIIDERLAGDQCAKWLDDRWHRSTIGTYAPRHPHSLLQLHNDISVCQSRQWGMRMLRLASEHMPLCNTSTASTADDVRTSSSVLLHCSHGCISNYARDLVERHNVVRPNSHQWRTPVQHHLGEMQSVHVARGNDGCVTASVDAQSFSGATVENGNVSQLPRSEQREPHSAAPPLLGYVVHPVNLWDDAVRFLFAGGHDPRPSSAGIVVPSWKCRGTASLAQQCAYLRAQYWPQASKSVGVPSSSHNARRHCAQGWWSPMQWMSSVSVCLHNAVTRPASHSPLLPTADDDHDGTNHTASPPLTAWQRQRGFGVEVVPACDPRWTLKASLKSNNNLDVRNSGALGGRTGLVGASFDSAPQRSTKLTGVMWRCEYGGQYAAAIKDVRDNCANVSAASAYMENSCVWARGLVEKMVAFSIRRWGEHQAADPRLCVLRARWCGAVVNPLVASSTTLLEVPAGLVRGLTFGPVDANGQVDPFLQQRTRTTQGGFFAASLEAQLLRVFGSGADATAYVNVLSLPLSGVRSSGHNRSSPSLLWSCGLSFSPATSATPHSSRGRVTEWNEWLPQRMECTFPLWFGSTSLAAWKEDGELQQQVNRSAAGISWMPRCGIIWDLL